MKNIGCVALLLLLFQFSSCEKEKVDGDSKDFRIDLATCQQIGDRPLFVLDNGTRLNPDRELPLLSGKSGRRFVVKYTYSDDCSGSDGRSAAVHSYNRVPDDTIRFRTSVELARMLNDPIEFTSVWYAGGRINVRFVPQENGETHQMNLFATRRRDDKDDLLRLVLRYDRDSGLPGHCSSGYASFYVDHLATEEISQMVIYINSFNYGEGFMPIDIKQKQE